MYCLWVKGQKDNTTIKAFCSLTQDYRPLLQKRANSKKVKSESLALELELELDGKRRIVSDQSGLFSISTICFRFKVFILFPIFSKLAVSLTSLLVLGFTI